MRSQIITLPDTNYNAKYENKPVLVQGKIKPLNSLEDRFFGVKTDGLVLHRTVKMYQWKENQSSTSEEKVGGGTQTVTTYDYVKVWATHRNDSASFRYPQEHHNPILNYQSQRYVTDATLGEFYLDKNIVEQISSRETYLGLNTMPKNIDVTTNHQSFLYIGQDPLTPMVGDIKISYSITPSASYTIAGAVKNKKIVEFVTKNNHSFVFIKNGSVNAETIFQDALDANNILTWALRAVGLILMFIGFKLIMALIATLANILPMVGSLVEGVTTIVSAVLTMIFGSTIIALAWFSSRPLLSLSIIGIGIAISVVLALFNKKSSSKREESVTPPQSRRS
ncbi:MAG: TMEM43 family protein [Campylobacterota bacterium]|nr:TMEM43 family protein [Campylobacterota bacterium]